MKKLLTITLLFLSVISFSQTDSTKTGGYLSIGISMTSTSDFLSSNYPSIEGGIVRNNFTLGLVLGRGNFIGMFESKDIPTNYYYEPKITASLPLGKLNGSVVFGYGGYFKTKHMFIEYGGGLSYTKGNISYGVLCSNWDKIVYLTPSITLNF